MKTAMQELLKHFIDEWSRPSDLWNPSKVIDKVESMIEKEKEQIIEAFNNGMEEHWNIFEDTYGNGASFYLNKYKNENRKK